MQFLLLHIFGEFTSLARLIRSHCNLYQQQRKIGIVKYIIRKIIKLQPGIDIIL
jgi:hypothetical protein